MHAPQPLEHTIVIRGMYGIGDNLHQRAPIKELLDQGRNVVLETFYWSMYEDLHRRGLRLCLIPGHMPRIVDGKQKLLVRDKGRVQGPIMRYRVGYSKRAIEQHGSILASQYAALGMRMPERPDFSLPVPPEWQRKARDHLLKSWRDKPLMVYRPSTLNNVWLSRARSPDPVAYRQLYEAIRDTFHVVSVCHLGNKGEVIDGEEMPADQKLHAGQLDFEALAGMFSIARMSLVCPGFAPVLSQAVSTPTAIVYGGNESFRTTNSVGAHLAPTLACEPINPCACHLKTHDCDKTMDMSLQLQRLRDFALRCAA